jgi:hypothetical protein
MHENMTWNTQEPLSTKQEIINYYVRHINMLDIVRHGGTYLLCVNGQGDHFKISTLPTNDLYYHRIYIKPIEPPQGY